MLNLCSFVLMKKQYKKQCFFSKLFINLSYVSVSFCLLFSVFFAKVKI